jgi:hypothetical protein
MAHAGISKTFLGALRETLLAYFLDIFGVFAGFLVVSQLWCFSAVALGYSTIM